MQYIVVLVYRFYIAKLKIIGWNCEILCKFTALLILWIMTSIIVIRITSATTPMSANQEAYYNVPVRAAPLRLAWEKTYFNEIF